MKQTITPAGYRLTVHSWENDADNSSQTIHEGLTKERLEFIVELLKLFKSRRSSNDVKHYGNMYEPSDYELTKAARATLKVMEKHRAVLDEDELELLNSAPLEDEEQGEELVDVTYQISEMVGAYLDTSEGYAFRVFDSARVQLVPQQIVLQDVTDQFFSKA